MAFNMITLNKQQTDIYKMCTSSVEMYSQQLKGDTNLNKPQYLSKLFFYLSVLYINTMIVNNVLNILK